MVKEPKDRKIRENGEAGPVKGAKEITMDDLNIDFTPGHVALIQPNLLLMELQKSGNAGYLADGRKLKDSRFLLLLESDGYNTIWVPLTTKKGKGYKINHY